MVLAIFTLTGLLAMRFFGGRATVKRCHWGIYACMALFIIMPGVGLAQAAYKNKIFIPGLQHYGELGFLSYPISPIKLMPFLLNIQNLILSSTDSWLRTRPSLRHFL